MSLVSINRKRPRGFSDTYDNLLSKQFRDQNGSNDVIIIDSEDDKERKEPSHGKTRRKDHIIDDEDEDDDDDIIILEEKQLTTYHNSSDDAHDETTSNFQDSDVIIDDEDEDTTDEYFDGFEVINHDFSFHDNDSRRDLNDIENNFELNNIIKKQRTNSLPQLPHTRCFYNRIHSNVKKQQKLGEIRTNIVPHQLDLPPCDDKDGHYVIKPGDLFANRFVIRKMLGQGTFGKVISAYDKLNKEVVAIKIIRNIPKYREASKIELRVLSTLKRFDNENLNHCIHLRECFDFRGHICIVTDLLKISLFDFLEKNKFIPFPGSHIQALSKQLIRSVTFLHDLNLIHTDLKPENILLHDDSYEKKKLTNATIIQQTKCQYTKILKDPLIQIIDFGSAIFNDEYHSAIVSTRHYRAPEIVLGTGWSFPCDMWSVGCILVELVTGEALFKTHENLEHLAMMEKILGGRIPVDLVKSSQLKKTEISSNFTFKQKLIYPNKDTKKQSTEYLSKLMRLDELVCKKIGLDLNFDYSISDNYRNNSHLIDFENFSFWWFFLDLVKKLLIFDPKKRITAIDALNHPWFNLGIEDEGTI